MTLNELIERLGNISVADGPGYREDEEALDQAARLLSIQARRINELGQQLARAEARELS